MSEPKDVAKGFFKFLSACAPMLIDHWISNAQDNARALSEMAKALEAHRAENDRRLREKYDVDR